MATTALANGTFTAVTTSRTVADGVTNATTTITSATAAFVAGDVGRVVTGSADLPNCVYIFSVTNGTTALLSEAATGSHSAQTFNLTNEFVLTSANAAASYTYHVDAVNMASGDLTELRIYQMILTGGSTHVAYMTRYNDAQPTDDLVKISVPISTETLTDPQALRFTIKQTAGTGRAYAWKVLKYA